MALAPIFSALEKALWSPPEADTCAPISRFLSESGDVVGVGTIADNIILVVFDAVVD